MLYLQKISAYRGNIISTIVDIMSEMVDKIAYRGNIISTIVDSIHNQMLKTFAYRGNIISTIVDSTGSRYDRLCL